MKKIFLDTETSGFKPGQICQLTYTITINDKVEVGKNFFLSCEYIEPGAEMMFLLVEDKDGLANIKKGNYRSNYNSQALMAKLTSIQIKYLNDTIFETKENTGFEILRKLKYAVRYFLMQGELEINETEAKQ